MVVIMNLSIRKALKSDEKEILELARKVTDEYTRTYLGDEAVDYYINSGSCDNDMKKDIDNMYLLADNDKIIGLTIFYKNLMNLLLIDNNYFGSGAAKFFCDKIFIKAFERYEDIILECFDKNERALAFYKKIGFKEYGREKELAVKGERILMRLKKEDY